MSRPGRTKYQPLAAESCDLSPDSEENEARAFLHTAEKAGRQASTRYFSRAMIVLTIFNSLALVASTSLFLVRYRGTHMSPNSFYKHTSAYTPLYDLFDVSPTMKYVNGSFYPPKHPSIGRQSPNPAADETWEEWEQTRVVPITRDQLIQLGKDPATAVKLPDSEFGLGDDAYVSILNVYHELHCLNSLRKIAYGGYYNKTQVKAERLEKMEMHVNHCVDMIMQALQCGGNLNLITYHWVETEPYPFPDMSINRQCIDFEKLTDWRLTNTVNHTQYKTYFEEFSKSKPKSLKQLPAPDGKFKYFLHMERPTGLLPVPNEDYVL